MCVFIRRRDTHHLMWFIYETGSNSVFKKSKTVRKILFLFSVSVQWKTDWYIDSARIDPNYDKHDENYCWEIIRFPVIGNRSYAVPCYKQCTTFQNGHWMFNNWFLMQTAHNCMSSVLHQCIFVKKKNPYCSSTNACKPATQIK